MDTLTTISGRLSTLLRLLLLTAALAVMAGAQSSSVDLTFNTVLEKGLTSASSTDFVLQPDNKIIVFGSFMSLNGAISSGVARINPDGTGDNTFNCTTCDFPVTSAVVQPDGKIIIAGGLQEDNGRTQPRIYRLNADGSRDTSFTSPYGPVTGISTGVILKVIALQDDGKIIVVNDAYLNGVSFQKANRLLPSGAFDSSFTNPTIGSSGHFVTSSNRAGMVWLLPDGKLLVARQPSIGLGQFAGVLDRYNPDGTVDSTFPQPTVHPNLNSPISDLSGWIRAFDTLPDGSMIIGGHFSTVNGLGRQNIAKLLPAGNVDLAFAISGIGDVSKVKVLPSGKFLVGTSVRIYRFNPDGSPDTSFNTPGDLSPTSWTLDSSGRIVVLSNLSGLSRIARLNDDGSVESQFTFASGVAASTTAAAQQPDGKIVVAGDFTRINGVLRTSMARLNPDGSLDTTFDVGSGFNGTVSQLIAQQDGKILAAGTFSTFNGISRLRLARLNSDGTLDNSFAPDLSSGTFSLNKIALQADGKILLGGTSGTINGMSRTGLARLNSNGSLDTSFNPIFGNPSIAAITVQPDGKIMVGGSFDGVNGFNRKYLARLNADGSVDGPFTAPATVFGVRQVELRSDGKYFILRNDTIIRLNNDGSMDASFVSPTFYPDLTEGAVDCILALSDGDVLAGGSFTRINNDTSAVGIARFGRYGGLDATFLPGGANGRVRTIVRQADGRVLAGGDFSMIGNAIRWGVARLNVAPRSFKTAFDFDGDSRADIAVFRPSDGNWYELRSNNNSFFAFHFGQQNDRVAAADYDGDGRTDIAVFRDSIPGAGNFAYFFTAYSADNSFGYVQFGSTGDVPVSGDWDGDGKADLAVYRDGSMAGGQSYFFYRPSGTPGVNFRAIPWGTTGDKPLFGDFDGDGKLDPAVFRPSNANWYILRSLDNQLMQKAFGLASDIPVPADFDGDGKTNIAVYRPSTGYWYTSTDPLINYGAVRFGTSGDVPVPADFDGDGKADCAVFRPSTGVWYMLRSMTGFTGVQFGLGSDKAVPNAFIR